MISSMPSTTPHIAKCPVCDSPSYKPLQYGGYVYDGQEMPLVKCEKCKLMYIIHGLPAERFDAFYNEHTYFDSEYAGGVEASYTESRAMLTDKARLALSIIHCYRPSGHLLDI